MWTPALTGGDAEVKLPFGLIFSTFMVCCMVGSSLFSILMDMQIKVEVLAVGIFGLASFSMLTVATICNPTLSFIAMNLFEIAVGLYWPTMGTMKGSIVPESKRAAIYNLYRIPLNFVVLFSLLTDLSPRTSFFLCGFMLAVATGLQVVLKKKRVDSGAIVSEKSDKPNKQEDMMVSLTAAEGGAEDKDGDV
jgi:MFS family permease